MLMKYVFPKLHSLVPSVGGKLPDLTTDDAAKCYKTFSMKHVEKANSISAEHRTPSAFLEGIILALTVINKQWPRNTAEKNQTRSVLTPWSELYTRKQIVHIPWTDEEDQYVKRCIDNFIEKFERVPTVIELHVVILDDIRNKQGRTSSLQTIHLGHFLDNQSTKDKLSDFSKVYLVILVLVRFYPNFFPFKFFFNHS
jgi:hypothetical protein